MNPRAFTLLEMLLATALATVLMAAVLEVLSAVSRDRLRLARMDATSATPAMINCLKWDLCNAQTMTSSTDGRSMIIVGHGAIDSTTLRPTGRLASVTYLAVEQSKSFHLVREQTLLDAPGHPDHWRELVGSDITGLWVIPKGGSSEAPVSATPTIPARVQVHVETASNSFDEDLWIK